MRLVLLLLEMSTAGNNEESRVDESIEKVEIGT